MLSLIFLLGCWQQEGRNTVVFDGLFAILLLLLHLLLLLLRWRLAQKLI